MQFDSEMPVIERREQISIARIVHHERDIVAHESRFADGPLCGAAIDCEQSFSGGYITASAHDEDLSSR
jgi:hypothetical protein